MRMIGAIAVAALAATAVMGGGKAAQAETVYPWCAQYDSTTSNCGFVTYQQCLATISGIGGICIQNPRYYGQVRGPVYPQPYGPPVFVPRY